MHRIPRSWLTPRLAFGLLIAGLLILWQGIARLGDSQPVAHADTTGDRAAPVGRLIGRPTASPSGVTATSPTPTPTVTVTVTVTRTTRTRTGGTEPESPTTGPTTPAASPSSDPEPTESPTPYPTPDPPLPTETPSETPVPTPTDTYPTRG